MKLVIHARILSIAGKLLQVCLFGVVPPIILATSLRIGHISKTCTVSCHGFCDNFHAKNFEVVASLVLATVFVTARMVKNMHQQVIKHTK